MGADILANEGSDITMKTKKAAILTDIILLSLAIISPKCRTELLEVANNPLDP